MDLRNYEVVEFRDKLSGRRRRGIKIGKHLAVVPEYKIYRYEYGKLLFDVSFSKIDDAIKFATWMDEVYAEMFILWESDPKLNIFSLAKWTVPNGQVVYELINLLEKSSKKFEMHELDKYLERAKENASIWSSQLSG